MKSRAAGGAVTYADGSGPHGKGTKYVARVLHKDAAAREQHEEMGFHDGWGKALDQLVAWAKTWYRNLKKKESNDGR